MAAAVYSPVAEETHTVAVHKILHAPKWPESGHTSREVIMLAKQQATGVLGPSDGKQIASLCFDRHDHMSLT